jgi:hypothetical protein
MDWRFVEEENWQAVHDALNGAGVESMQAKWEEMFGLKKEVVEDVKVKKPRKKAVKSAEEAGKPSRKKTTSDIGGEPEKDKPVKKTTTRKSPKSKTTKDT